MSVLPLLHAGGLALWAAALVSAALPAAAASGARRALAIALTPAALLALFTAIALFHGHPEQWFTPAGKARAALLTGVIALDAATQGLSGRAGLTGSARWPRLVGALVASLAAAQVALTWVSPWKT